VTLVLPQTTPLSDAGHTQLLLAALLGIATVVLTIVWAKFHPLLGLMLGTAVLALVAWVPPEPALQSFLTGLGSTFGSVGLLIALGAMLGKLLADSGGANKIVDTIVDKVGPKTLPWAMALIAAIIGLPMFFEIGVVILVPIIVLVAIRTGARLMLIGIPALAGLSILHGLVPPHPGPLTAIALLHADLGYTLIFGLICAVPTLVIAGPLLAQLIVRWVDVDTPQPERRNDREVSGGAAALSQTSDDTGRGIAGDREAGATRTPTFALSILAIVLPVLLMLVRAVDDVVDKHDVTNNPNAFDFIGEPTIALLVGVLVAMVAVGRPSGMNRGQINESLGSGLPGVASIMLIVAAGGGFKQELSDSGVANVIADAAKGSHLSVLLLGWLVAVGIRLATGSATVATVTAAGIVGPLGQSLSTTHLSLLVLAIGAGSLFFSHVNDAGFWLVKQYFGLTVWETIKSWSVMETVISVVALICVLILSLIV
jgi:gluconate:H+ symporter, GntP family